MIPLTLPSDFACDMRKQSRAYLCSKRGGKQELLPEHGPTRDDVMAWAKEEARLETLKYKLE